MENKYKIVVSYIQDLSVEIPSAETFMISREHITKYVLSININTKTLKNKMLEVDLIVLATPSGFHSIQCIKAAKLGLNICTEKPMALNLKDARGSRSSASKPMLKSKNSG